MLQPVIESITLGGSGAQVLLSKHSDLEVYQKSVQRSEIPSLRREKEVLQWLYGRFPCPEIVSFSESSDGATLTTTALAGLPCSDPSFAPQIESLVVSLGRILRALHALPILDCPFDERLDLQLAKIEHRVASGQVDTSNFHKAGTGQGPRILFEQLVSERPKEGPLVFTHGDACLPNIIVDPRSFELTGLVDLGSAGVADFYRDLALTSWSIGYNFGSQYEPLLFEAYGLESVDTKKIHYYRLLDEFS